MVFYALVFGAVIGGFMLLGRPATSGKLQGSTSPRNVSQLAVSESVYDFGTVSMAAGKVSHVFTIKNPTPKPQTATKLYTSCMCTAATLLYKGRQVGPFGMPGHGFIPEISETIAPGEEAAVEVVFDPAAHGPAGVGRIERTVILETSSGSLQLGFAAQVKP